MFLRQWWVLRDGWHTHTTNPGMFRCSCCCNSLRPTWPETPTTCESPYAIDNKWKLRFTCENQKWKTMLFGTRIPWWMLGLWPKQPVQSTEPAGSQYPEIPVLRHDPVPSLGDLCQVPLAIFVQWWEDGGIHNLGTFFLTRLPATCTNCGFIDLDSYLLICFQVSIGW